MTIEEAKKLVEKLFEESDYCDCGNRNIYDYEIQEEVIDKIYDSFESRVCRNCKYSVAVDGYEEDSYECSDSWEIFGYDGIIFPSGFGCNKFKRKEDNETYSYMD